MQGKEDACIQQNDWLWSELQAVPFTSRQPYAEINWTVKPVLLHSRSSYPDTQHQREKCYPNPCVNAE